MSRPARTTCCWTTASITRRTIPPPRAISARRPCARRRIRRSCGRRWPTARIQTVSTDHCSFTLKQKDAGRGDFTKIPGGLPGVETRGELLYTAGVAEGRITKEQMCALLSENPARLYGAYPRKGVLAPGSDADIVVYDPAADKTITGRNAAFGRRLYPLRGLPDEGLHRAGLSARTLAVDHGEMKAGPIGTYIPRHPGAL